MKKVLALMLALVFVLSLAACGEQKSEETSANTEPAQTQTEAADDTADETEGVPEDRLPFLETGEVYFDINLSSGVFDDLKIKLGDQEITQSGKIKFDGSDSPVVEGTGDGSNLYVVIYSANPQILFNEAVVATTDLQRALEIIFNTFAKGKSYLLISDKRDGFDHSLNDKLTEYLGQYITE